MAYVKENRLVFLYKKNTHLNSHRRMMMKEILLLSIGSLSMGLLHTCTLCPFLCGLHKFLLCGWFFLCVEGMLGFCLELEVLLKMRKMLWLEMWLWEVVLFLWLVFGFLVLLLSSCTRKLILGTVTPYCVIAYLILPSWVKILQMNVSMLYMFWK